MSLIRKLIALIVIIAALGLYFWDANLLKPEVESHLTNVEGHEVNLGDIEHSLFDLGKVIIHDLTIHGEAINGQIGKLTLDIDVSRALRKEIILNEIELYGSDLKIDMSKLQQLAEQKQKQAQEEAEDNPTPDQTNKQLPIKTLLVKSAKLSNAKFKDVSEQRMFTVEGVKVSTSDALLVNNKKLVLLDENNPLILLLDAKSVRGLAFPQASIEAMAKIQKSKIELKTLQLSTEKSEISLNAQLETKADETALTLSVAESKLDISDLTSIIKEAKIQPQGIVNFTLDATTSGAQKDINSLLSQLTATTKLSMQEGKLTGIDINQLLSAYKKSKETDLADIGGFLISGPMGLIASNMFDLGTSGQGMDGETVIPQLNLQGEMKDGVIHIQDTALATDKFRLAFKGGINPLKQEFNDFTFAILNDQGCADVEQTLNGSLQQPTSAVAETLLDTALAPISGLLNTVKNTVTECKPFYQGEVAHP